MSTLYNNFQAVAAAWEIERRILLHTQAGGMLEGLNYDAEGTLKLEGEDDLPVLQPWGVTLEETLFVGAPASRGAGKDEANVPCYDKLTLVYRFATSRSNGWFRRDPTVETSEKGFLEWLAVLRDAIELPSTEEDITTVKPDARLSGTANKPVSFAIQENTTTQLSFQCMLEIRLDLKAWCRAERSYTLPEPE